MCYNLCCGTILQLSIMSVIIRTYYNHQRLYLFPLVLDKWRRHQEEVLNECPQKMTLEGDCRSASPGHCAKYGAYSLLEGNINKVIEIQVVQVSKMCLKKPNPACSWLWKSNISSFTYVSGSFFLLLDRATKSKVHTTVKKRGWKERSTSLEKSGLAHLWQTGIGKLPRGFVKTWPM